MEGRTSGSFMQARTLAMQGSVFPMHLSPPSVRLWRARVQLAISSWVPGWDELWGDI